MTKRQADMSPEEAEMSRLYDRERRTTKRTMMEKVNEVLDESRDEIQNIVDGVQEDKDIFETLDKLQVAQNLSIVNEPLKEVTYESDEDVLRIIPIGDLHLENLSVDIPRMKEQLRLIPLIPNSKCIFLGDGADNSIKYPDSAFDTSIPPKAARNIFYQIMDYLKSKLIFMISGCHEKFGDQIADFDYVEEYAQRENIPYLGERGSLAIKLKDKEFKFGVSHKTVGYSMHNIFHGSMRLLREEFMGANGIISGHIHQSAISVQPLQGKQVALMVIGSRKSGDKYAVHRGFSINNSNLNLPVLEIRSSGGFVLYNDISEVMKI